jgi:hypothetical protein
MAAQKKTQRKNNTSRKKFVARKKSKTAASASSRKMSVKAKTKKSKTAKSKLKARPKFAAKSMLPRRAAAKSGKRLAGERVRIFRSNLPTRGEAQDVETVNLDPKGLGSDSGGQSGALQGLSNVESADSESVGELIEEGNSFEAGIVKGVQDASNADESEVRTHQRPQDEDLAEDSREN